MLHPIAILQLGIQNIEMFILQQIAVFYFDEFISVYLRQGPKLYTITTNDHVCLCLCVCVCLSSPHVLFRLSTLSVSLSVCPFPTNSLVCLFVCLSFSDSQPCLSVCLWVLFQLSTLSVCCSVCQSLRLSVCLLLPPSSLLTFLLQNLPSCC